MYVLHEWISLEDTGEMPEVLATNIAEEFVKDLPLLAAGAKAIVGGVGKTGVGREEGKGEREHSN